MFGVAVEKNGAWQHCQMNKQLIGSFYCLKCRGCCRFAEAVSVWTPTVSAEEEKILSSSGAIICKSKLATVPGAEAAEYACSLLNQEDNKCRLYTDRPLECRLYPFVINAVSSKVFLCVDLNCPFAREHFRDVQFVQYVEYLSGYFNSKPALELLRSQRQLIQSYPADMPELFEILL
jgi:Fe-S-cluster containining protein